MEYFFFKSIQAVCIAIFLLGCSSELDPKGSQIGLSIPHQLKERLSLNLESLANRPEYEWLDQSDSIWSLTYSGQTFEGAASKVFAYYASPATLSEDVKNATDFPGIVLVHGGLGTAYSQWVSYWANQGYAAIAMDLDASKPLHDSLQSHSWGNAVKPLEAGGSPMNYDYMVFHGDTLLQNDTWQYHTISNVISAHSLLRSFQEVDTSRTVITGISWGAYSTQLVLGIDHRFKAGASVYGCGYSDESGLLATSFEKMGKERTKQWMSLWDPSQYLPNCRTPILFINGTNDFAFYVEPWSKTTALVQDKSQLLIPELAHSQQVGAALPEIPLYFESILNQSSDLPRFGQIERISKSRMKAQLPESFQKYQYQLVYTKDTLENVSRKWHLEDLHPTETLLSMSLPDSATLVYILGIDTQKKYRFSSDMLRLN